MNIRAVPGFASLAPTAVADPTIIAQSEFLGSIVAAANQALGQPAGVTLLPLSTGGGVFNYDYVYPVVSNNEIVFNSYQDFNSLLGPVGTNGALNMTAGFSTAYASLLQQIRWNVSTADQATVSAAQQNASTYAVTMVSIYEGLYGVITPGDLAASGYANKQDYITSYQISQIWSGFSTGKGPLLSIPQSGVTPQMIPFAPNSAITQLLPQVNLYVIASSPQWPITNAYNAATAELLFMASNIKAPNANYQTYNPLTGASVAEPGYSTSPTNAELYNVLGPTAQAAGQLVITATASQSNSDVYAEFSQQAQFFCSGGFFFSSMGVNSQQFSLFSANGSGTTATIKLIFPNPVLLSLAPFAYDSSNPTAGWYDSKVVRQALSNTNNATGFMFGSAPQMNLQAGGNYGRLTSLAVSQMPTILIDYATGDMQQFNKTVAQQSEWVTTFCGIPIGEGSSSQYSATSSLNQQGGGFTLTMTPPSQTGLATYDLYSYILGGAVGWPGVQDI
jgi:hypothetical protein